MKTVKLKTFNELVKLFKIDKIFKNKSIHFKLSSDSNFYIIRNSNKVNPLKYNDLSVIPELFSNPIQSWIKLKSAKDCSIFLVCVNRNNKIDFIPTSDNRNYFSLENAISVFTENDDNCEINVGVISDDNVIENLDSLLEKNNIATV